MQAAHAPARSSSSLTILSIQEQSLPHPTWTILHLSLLLLKFISFQTSTKNGAFFLMPREASKREAKLKSSWKVTYRAELFSNTGAGPFAQLFSSKQLPKHLCVGEKRVQPRIVSAATGPCKSLKATIWFRWFKIIIFYKAHFNQQRAAHLRGLYQVITMVHASYSPLSCPAFLATSLPCAVVEEMAPMRWDAPDCITSLLPVGSLGGFAGCSSVSSPLVLLELWELQRTRPGSTQREASINLGRVDRLCTVPRPLRKTDVWEGNIGKLRSILGKTPARHGALYKQLVQTAH